MASKITVALTGVSGYIGSRICADLVAKNFAVHAIVRSNKNNSDLKNFGDSVSIFEVPDLGKGDLTPAFSGCQYVMHVASPVTIEGQSESDVLTPAVDNTLNILRTAKKLGTKRVIFTSTMATICGTQREKDPKHVWTEKDWNDKPGSLYSRSKVLQEKTAWDFVKENPEVELVTIHPAMVLGPVTFPSSISIVSYVLNVAKGMFKEKGLPPMTAGMSDVRDVSLAHIAALESPAAANQRYIVALPDQYSMLDIAKSIKKQFPQLDVADYEEKPTTPVLNGIDASKAKHDLKLELTSFDKTIRDTIQSLIDAKLLNNPL